MTATREFDHMQDGRPTGYVLTDRDLYYLKSIQRQLSVLGEGATASMPSLASEVAADDRDWLDCFIEMVERRADATAETCTGEHLAR